MIKNLSIAKNIYSFNKDIKDKISNKKWIEFIDCNSDFFTWLENTEAGKNTLKNIEKIPESFRQGILQGHNKLRAFGDYNLKKGYFEMYVDYDQKYGKISTTFMKPIKKEHIKLLLDMANHMDALLLNNGNEIISEEMLENYS